MVNLGENLKKLLSYLKPGTFILPKCKVHVKQKKLSLGPKFTYLKMFGLEFKKAIVIFKINAKFHVIQKTFSFGPKMPFCDRI